MLRHFLEWSITSWECMVDHLSHKHRWIFLRTEGDSRDCSVLHLGWEGKGDFGWVRSMKGMWSWGRRDASLPAFSLVHSLEPKFLPLHFRMLATQARPWPEIQSGDYKIEQAWIKARYSNDMLLIHMYHVLCQSSFFAFVLLNPFAPGDFAEKRVLKLVEWFSGHCHAIKS